MRVVIVFSFALSILFFPTTVVAETSVWVIKRGKNVLYLGGTYHMLRPTDYPLPEEFEAAFKKSSVLVFEGDMSATPEDYQRLLRTKGFFLDERTLDQVISPAAWAAFEGFCKRHGHDSKDLNHLKPWAAFTFAIMTSLQKIAQAEKGVDRFFHEKAKLAAKKVMHFESSEIGSDILVHSVDGTESEAILLATESEERAQEKFATAVQAWRAGDEDALYKDSEGIRKKTPLIYERLVVQRNEKWLPQIEAFMNTEEVEFVLVGAGHAVGPQGLLIKLKQRGYTVERYLAEPSSKSPDSP